MKQLWDKIGVGLSITCLLHCLLTPLIPLIFPFLSNQFESPLVHQVFFFLVALSAFVAFYPHRNQSQAKKVLSLGLSAVIIIGFSIFVALRIWGHHVELVLTVMGSLLLIYAHVINLRSCRIKSCH